MFNEALKLIFIVSLGYLLLHFFDESNSIVLQKSLEESIKQENENQQDTFVELKQKNISQQKQLKRHMLNRQMTEQVSDSYETDLLTAELARVSKMLPELSGLLFTEVDCRETLCVVNFRFESSILQQRAALLITSIATLFGEPLVVTHDLAKQKSRIYLQKADNNLSKLALLSEIPRPK